MFQHSSKFDNALVFSRFDAEHLLATVAPRGFDLDGYHWFSAEHYYQANKFPPASRHWQRVAAADTPAWARRLGKRWYWRKRRDFKTLRPVLMTRALYTVACQHRAVAAYLMASGDRPIVESGLYEYYWGMGRDHRGENRLGKIWMDIRTKLREQQIQQ